MGSGIRTFRGQSGRRPRNSGLRSPRATGTPRRVYSQCTRGVLCLSAGLTFSATRYSARDVTRHIPRISRDTRYCRRKHDPPRDCPRRRRCCRVVPAGPPVPSTPLSSRYAYHAGRGRSNGITMERFGRRGGGVGGEGRAKSFESFGNLGKPWETLVHQRSATGVLSRGPVKPRASSGPRCAHGGAPAVSR